MNKHLPETMGVPGHSNTVTESNSSIHPIELFLEILLCFLHQKHGYNLIWPLSNPAAAHPGKFISGDALVASNPLNSTSDYVSCLAQILPEGCARSFDRQDQHLLKGISGAQSHAGLCSLARRKWSWWKKWSAKGLTKLACCTDQKRGALVLNLQSNWQC